VHFGHLRPVQEVYQDLMLDELLWIPAAVPPHRDEPQVSVKHRLSMLQLALQANPAFKIDTRELERSGPSYMVDTLVSLRQDYEDASLALIMGQDAFNGLPQWHRWQSILELAHIIVCTRPGSEFSSTGELMTVLSQGRVENSQQLKSAPAGLIYTHPVTQLPISATQIRRLCEQGKSPRYLMPERVCEYIQEHNLYETQSGK